MKVVLGSASPRREELLKKITPEFDICPANVDETLPEDIGPEFAPIFLAATKSDALTARFPDSLVITADTVVVCDGVILGKPHDEKDAKRMLTALSGKEHKVITGCCLALGENSTTFQEETLVRFFPLSEEEIDRYVAGGEPMDKAGAYAIQGEGALFVEGIDGDFYNVIGLPIARLKREWDAFLSEIGQDLP